MPTRRDVLKLGLLSGGSGLLHVGSGARLLLADDSLPPSPQLTPFVSPLPLPPPPPEVPAFLPFDSDTGGAIGDHTKFYWLVEEEAWVSIHPDLPPTKMWRYRPRDVEKWGALGPTFNVRMAENSGGGVVVRMQNLLPANHVGFGVPDMTTHLHGGHHLAASDGFPDNAGNLGFTPVIRAGARAEFDHYDYIYPMRDVGFRHGDPDPTERPSTLWYHDHLFDFTGPNVVRGLAGFYLVFDDLDTGAENTGLRLPSGEFDVPVVIQDRRIGSDGQLRYDPLDHDGFLGDTFLLNGAAQPFVNVKKRKYRFRFLNGSNARFYRMVLASADGSTTVPLTQIATEGGLLAAPIRGIRYFQFAPAERIEVVVDFSAFPVGTVLYLENRLEQTEGRKPDGVLSRGTRLLKVEVTSEPDEADQSRVPDVLRPFAPISQEELAGAVRKTFKFDRTDGAWAINGELADLDHALTHSRLNQGEIWHLEASGGWAHPVHLHLEFMRVLRRNGSLPRLNERDGMAKKDTVVIGADFGDVDVFVKFRDYPGPFVFHCHNIEHEDMRMMARMDVHE